MPLKKRGRAGETREGKPYAVPLVTTKSGRHPERARRLYCELLRRFAAGDSMLISELSKTGDPEKAMHSRYVFCGRVVSSSKLRANRQRGETLIRGGPDDDRRRAISADRGDRRNHQEAEVFERSFAVDPRLSPPAEARRRRYGRGLRGRAARARAATGGAQAHQIVTWVLSAWVPRSALLHCVGT